MRTAIILGMLVTVAGVILAWQVLYVDSGGGALTVRTINLDTYRGPLTPGEQPSGFVDDVQTVALVTVLDVEEPRWNSPDGSYPGDSAVSFGTGLGLVYTPVLVSVDQYIKGAGPDKIRISQLGGARDGISVTMDNGYKFDVGMEAVVFLNPPGTNISGWTLEDAYVVSGGRAYSKWDDREMAVTDLIAQLRHAAELESGPLDPALP